MNERDELPPPTEYQGSARALSNSRFYSAADLIEAGMSYGQATTVTIDKVLRRDGVVSQFSGRAETMRTLMFVGKKKEFRVNQTAWKKLIELFGDDCSQWKGQKIQLMLTQMLQAKTGEMIDVIVLRNAQPIRQHQPGPAAPQPAPVTLPEPVEDEGTTERTDDDIPF